MSKMPHGEGIYEEPFQVQSILDRKIQSDETHFYLIKWRGYSKQQSTWQPLCNLLGDKFVEAMVQEFDKVMDKKIKYKWKNGLSSWANAKKVNRKDENNINIDNLEKGDGKNHDQDIIDLEYAIENQNRIGSKQDLIRFIQNKIRRKTTQKSEQVYPFQVKKPPPTHFLEKKLKQIVRMETENGKSKFLVRWKYPFNQEEWVQADLLRLVEAESVLEIYEKLYREKEQNHQE